MVILNCNINNSNLCNKSIINQINNKSNECNLGIIYYFKNIKIYTFFALKVHLS